MSFLVSVEDGVGVEGQELFQYLRNQVEIADDAEGLPAFTHRTTTPGRLSAPGNLAIVGWAGSGRGPRLPALAWLLRTASEVGPDHVDAVIGAQHDAGECRMPTAYSSNETLTLLHDRFTGIQVWTPTPAVSPSASVMRVRDGRSRHRQGGRCQSERSSGSASSCGARRELRDRSEELDAVLGGEG